MAAAPGNTGSRSNGRAPRVESVEQMRAAVARATAAAAPIEPIVDPYGHVGDRAGREPSPPARPRLHAEELPPRLFDPRETEDWFQRLPRERQQEIRAYWQWDADRGARWIAARRSGRRRAAVDGGIMLALVWALATVWTAPSLTGFVLATAIAFAVGAGAGTLVSWRGGGRFSAAALGIGAWLAVAVVTGFVGAASTGGGIGMMFLLGMWMVAHLFAAWGQHLEFRDG